MTESLSPTEPTPLDQALDWHLRLPELVGAGWGAFVAWLEAAPEHRAAYDQVVAADALAGAGLAGMALAERPAPSNDIAPVATLAPRWPRRGVGLAMAAAACLALVGGWALEQRDWPWAWQTAGGPQTERTEAGTTKELAFADGTRIDLNGQTELALDQADPRAVRLGQGEARFAVRHGAKPFTVQAGGFELRDLGTVFNVRLTPVALQLDVTEGRVLFDPGGANLMVGAGEQVRVDRARNLVVKQAGKAAGDWRDGDFVFDDATLADVAQAVYRRYGWRLIWGAGLSERPFTGNIRLSGNAAVDVPHLAGLIGAQYRREGEGWLIDSADRAR
ncbi:MAG TPA: FecR domain-containing protein [Novosphingobium sp.]